MKKKYSEKEIIKAVTGVRRRNNLLWMMLLKTAMKDPAMKPVIREICKNDRTVVKWMSRI
jgi:hypothetical protein